MTDRAAVPAWYWILAALLCLWGAMGIYSFYTELTTSYDQLAASMGKVEADAVANMPQWLWWVFGAAVWSGTFGSLALLLRSAWARPLYLISLVSVIIQFGYIFLIVELILLHLGRTRNPRWFWGLRLHLVCTPAGLPLPLGAEPAQPG